MCSGVPATNDSDKHLLMTKVKACLASADGWQTPACSRATRAVFSEFTETSTRSSITGMATTLEPGSAITAELEQFYADAETQDFAEDALLDWLDGALTGFENDRPEGALQGAEVGGPRPSATC